MRPGPAVDLQDRRVYVGTSNYSLMCLPIDEPTPVDQEIVDGDRYWVFTADRGIYGTPSLYRGPTRETSWRSTSATPGGRSTACVTTGMRSPRCGRARREATSAARWRERGLRVGRVRGQEAL